MHFMPLQVLYPGKLLTILVKCVWRSKSTPDWCLCVISM